MAVNKEKIDQLLLRNVEEIYGEPGLRTALLLGKKLRVKFGIDPTGDKIHIGRAVVFWKLKEFQDLGHTIVLIIGDFTAQIGDPSDKLEKRPFLSNAQIKKNLKDYLSQIFSFQQMRERRNFKERLENHQEISLREGMYPLMQGYDSVAIKADVELGGTDQLFNLLAGRKI